MLKQILLGLLNYHPATGYDLKRVIDLSTAHFWHAYHSQIYTTLRKMEDEGLVVSEMDEDDDRLERRVYTLTDAGRANLRAWLETPLTDLPPNKDELMVRLFFSGERNSEAIVEELRVQRALRRKQLEVYDDIPIDDNAARLAAQTGEDFERRSLFWRMTLEHGRMYEEMYIAWLDKVISQLEADA
jgi:DNA-binding PadR family transcriptional regulator